ncbi:DUF3078 domain-containing protein [Bacteroidia bacterium]|nr:DUF3078 domain-containing protein [Bacteroidia bacterium]
MKKYVLLLCIVALVFTANAQNNSLETKKSELSTEEAILAATQAKIDALKAEIEKLTPEAHWAKGGFAALNFNSLGLTNWAAGGVESNSITAIGNIYRNYKKDKVAWVNNLDLAYGLIQNAGQGIRKNEDKIDLFSKVGYQASNKLNYAAIVNLRTQFAPGFDFSNDTIPDENRNAISDIFAPATILASLGMDYNFTDYFSVYLSPATGKFTIVADDDIAQQNIYIPVILDENNQPFYSNSFRPEFGASLNARFKKDLTERINLTSTLNLFNNYTDVNKDNRKNIDVNWETMLNMKLTDYIGMSLYTNVIHDDDIKFQQFDEAGNAIHSVALTQFKRLLGVGFSYKF